MPLVDYDSSDEEDEQEQQQHQEEEVPKKVTDMPTARKTVDGRKKIIVALPAATAAAMANAAKTGPSNKRPAGAMSGLASLLPPPKRPSRVNPINKVEPVSLSEKEQSSETQPAAPAKPLFVPRPVAVPKSAFSSSTTTTTKKIVQPLFTIHTSQDRETDAVTESAEYTPLLPRAESSRLAESHSSEQKEGGGGEVYSNEDYKYDASIDYAALPSFQPADVTREQDDRQRRQEIKRGRSQQQQQQQPPAESEMLDYDLSREYAQNALLASSEATAAAAAAAPVRFVGGGKHQLSSLLNLAHSQRDSFEESFAAQKRAIRDGKARYGR